MVDRVTRWYTKGGSAPVEVELLTYLGEDTWEVRQGNRYIGEEEWEEEGRNLFYFEDDAWRAYANWLSDVTAFLANMPYASRLSILQDVNNRIAVAYSRLDKGR